MDCAARPRRMNRPRRRLLAAALLLGVAAEPLVGSRAEAPPGTVFYSTAIPPADLAGLRPRTFDLARLASSPTDAAVARTGDLPPLEPPAAAPAPVPVPAPAPAPARSIAPEPGVTRLATAPSAAESVPALPRLAAEGAGADLAPPPPAGATAPTVDPAVEAVARAKRTIAAARQRFAQVQDYTCTFTKRERVEGRMTPLYVMSMKARPRPQSIYFKFLRPNDGREAIYVQGRNNGKVMVHDVGIGKLLAGTLALDPRGSRAMEDNRHPITEAGLGYMIETIHTRWNAEMKAGETQVTIRGGARVGPHACTMIDSTHPRRHASFLFHKVRVYFDDASGLPVRFEAYDWPRRPGAAPELVEEYTYQNLRLNVGLSDTDFDPSNEAYSFGRF